MQVRGRPVRSLVRVVLAAGILASTTSARAQAPGPVAPADYGRFESLGFRTPMAPDGTWLAAPISRVDGTFDLQVHAVAGGDPVVVESGSNPAFSKDSAWLACEIGHTEDEREKLRESREPVRDGMCLLRLGESEATRIDQVQGFAFSGDGAFLAYRRYPASDEAKGADLMVRDLATGAQISLGNVSEFSWQDGGALLALAITTADEIGNGVQLYDARGGSLRVLESGEATFSQLSWRDESDDLALLRSYEDGGREGPSHLVIGWRALSSGGSVVRLDPATNGDFPADMRVSEHRAPTWSDDGSALFLGLREWHTTANGDEPVGGAPDGAEPITEGETEPVEATGDEPGVAAAPDPIEPSDVQIWHSRDEMIVPMQTVFSGRLEAAVYLARWDPASDRLLQIGTDLNESVTLLEGQRHAVETDRTRYEFDNRFDRDWNDYWLIDLATGERRKVIEEVGFFYGGSPRGRHLLYFKDDQFWSYDIDADSHHELTSSLPTSFVDDQYDTPVWRQQPPWGVGGWLADERAVLLYDHYDVWAVPPGGGGVLRLTEGAAEQVEHRVLDLDREEPGLDPAAIYLSLYGEWTKKFGIARSVLQADDSGNRADGDGTERLVWLDKNVGRLSRAEDAEIYSYVVQGFDDSPDVFVGDADLATARQVTTTNPFQADFAWGRSELVDYESAWGERLQGALFYPANYEPGKQYPMIVYVYERLSQTMHSYTVPSERNPYDTTVWNAEGYFVLRPDIVFRNRLPGTSAVECVVPAVEAAVATGMIDADRVGLVGHSWGGYEASYVPTRANVFAASVAGAALTNFFSMFGTIHWNQGLPETDHFETGQARMEVPYWDDTEAYLRESPVIHIQSLETPMMLFFGDSDGTVDWHQGIEMYNYARRAGKELVMLVYPGENHSARQKNNQVDYHRRVLQWFGHYLKGDEAPGWITEGISVADRKREVEALRKR